MDIGSLFSYLIILFLLLPPRQASVLGVRRTRAPPWIQRVRNSRVIAMVHRQETIGFLGVPLYRFIDIDHSQEVLRATVCPPHETPIDLILHTPGGLVLASEQIAYALRAHPGKVTVLVPHYA